MDTDRYFFIPQNLNPQEVDDMKKTFERVKEAHTREVINAFNMGVKAGREEADKTLRERLIFCRNELCLRCGQYKTAHEGSCNGCRWKENYA